MPKAPSSQSAAQSQGNKQTTLLGFFGKAGGPPPPRSSPAGPSSTATANDRSKAIPANGRKTSHDGAGSGDQNHGFVSPLIGKTTSSSASTRVGSKTLARNASKESATIEIDQNGDDEGGILPTPSASSVILPPSAPSSLDKPANNGTRAAGKAMSGEGTSSPLSEMEDDSKMDIDDNTLASSGVNGTAPAGTSRTTIVDSDDEESGRRISVRSSKRKVIYAESDTDVVTPPLKNRYNGGTSAVGGKRRKVDDEDEDDYYDPQTTLARDDNDDEDFEMDDFDLDTAAFDAAMTQLDVPAKNGKQNKATGVSRSSKYIFDPSASSSSKTAKGGASDGKRPPVKPTASKASSGRASGQGGSFLTQAEKAKLDAREKKKESENCFSFLVDIKDKAGRHPDDPEYDNRTIFIPRSAWSEFTPFETQFWEIKQNHFDTVLFFQKGKFYELYENDAEIGHNEFDLKLTDRVKMKMVGVPEQSFDFWASKFLAAGYKVGKVEQAETAVGMEMRNKGKTASKSDSIVRRELASVLTNGTVVDEAFLASEEASHCVAVKEGRSADGLTCAYGICILDAATGQFEITTFEDDAVNTKLETISRQLRIKELLHEKGNLSSASTRLLKTTLSHNASWVPLRPKTEFFDFDRTVEELNKFFQTEDGEAEVPSAIADALEARQNLAIEALGGMIFYLRSLNMATDLLSQRSFNVYDPIRKGECMVLDGQTLGHLEILLNNEGDEEGTLLQLLQRCVTPFGKRLFRIWLTVPLCRPDGINARLDAVEDLMANPAFAEQFAKLSKGTPDLERLISRIHAGRCRQSDFLKVITSFDRLSTGFGRLSDIAKGFDTSSVGDLIRSVPDISAMLRGIKGMYTLSEENTIVPTVGASEVCDEAAAAVQAIEDNLDALLVKLRKTTGCRELSFWHSPQGSKDIYQVQAPGSFDAPDRWAKSGGTKTQPRYTVPSTLSLIKDVQEARETKKIAFQEFYGTLMKAFDEGRETWLKVVRTFAELDCLMSLAKSSAEMDEPKCRPQIIDRHEASVDFVGLRHPCMSTRMEYIPNDVKLGSGVARSMLLTGPNTGGKSSIMKSTAIGLVLAQLGCLVPADAATIAPVDRIVTRMGAYDALFTGLSTFAVEMNECKKILGTAGPKAFVVLDETGRGTSSFDGEAIAEAILHHLAVHTLPLAVFSTHYHTLTEAFRLPEPHPNVRCQHMATQVGVREVTNLYKLIDGVAESSYGLHVAKRGGVPDSVVNRAETVSKEFYNNLEVKLALRRKSKLTLIRQADFAFLVNLGKQSALNQTTTLAPLADQLSHILHTIV